MIASILLCAFAASQSCASQEMILGSYDDFMTNCTAGLCKAHAPNTTNDCSPENVCRCLEQNGTVPSTEPSSNTTSNATTTTTQSSINSTTTSTQGALEANALQVAIGGASLGAIGLICMCAAIIHFVLHKNKSKSREETVQPTESEETDIEPKKVKPTAKKGKAPPKTEEGQEPEAGETPDPNAAQEKSSRRSRPHNYNKANLDLPPLKLNAQDRIRVIKFPRNPRPSQRRAPDRSLSILYPSFTRPEVEATDILPPEERPDATSKAILSLPSTSSNDARSGDTRRRNYRSQRPNATGPASPKFQRGASRAQSQRASRPGSTYKPPHAKSRR